MDDREATSPVRATFESLQMHSASMRRARPPEMDAFSDENRVPLRLERPSKRESRLGLRNLFSRSKNSKALAAAIAAGEMPASTSSLRESSRPAGIRASLAEISNWPYGYQTPKSEASLLSLPAMQSRPLSPARPPLSSGRAKPTSSTRGMFPPTPPASARSSVNIWDAPPLFQAYPQAIRYTTLPVCTTPLETLVKMGAARSNAGDARQDAATLDNEADASSGKLSDKWKRKHQRGVLSKAHMEWTTKIFVLATSGYLLQYSTDGVFDRLPEATLQLTKDSAVFASDLIPGKHWVLQVVSSLDTDSTSTDSKALISKMSVKSGDKRGISNCLLVFENADDMGGWLSDLRQAIEAAGGKKRASETGNPGNDEPAVSLATRRSQRNTVVRDSVRFSRIESRQLRPEDDAHDEIDGTSSLYAPEIIADDRSTTGSLVSCEGQHLESLRDSSNRLSYISSGQRTVITSAGSSPACSPTRASFSSQIEELLPIEGQSEVRVRPNAAAIANRRQSMQTIMPTFDVRLEPAPRPLSALSNSSANETSFPAQQHSVSSQSVPHFSVPNSIHKRFSTTKQSNTETPASILPPLQAEPPIRTGRKAPPTALPKARPLSVVVDQPSPTMSDGDIVSPTGFRKQLRLSHSHAQLSYRQPLPPSDTWMPPSSSQYVSNGTHDLYSGMPSSEAVDITDPDSRLSPRRFGSLDNLRESEPGPGSSGRMARIAEEPSRAASAMDSWGPSRRLSMAPTTKYSANRRASYQPADLPFHPRHSTTGVPGWRQTSAQTSIPQQGDLTGFSRSSPRPSPAALPSAETIPKTLQTFRSMPQLAESSSERPLSTTVLPPPVPPPNRALPALPPQLGPPPAGALPPLPRQLGPLPSLPPQASSPPTSALPPLPPPTCALPPIPTKLHRDERLSLKAVQA